MKKRNVIVRTASVLLAAVLLLSLCPTVFAAERTICIGTQEELCELAERCASDVYSKGLTVILTADIDAGGEAISIPVFFGTFDGQGHHIYSLTLSGNASLYGLFSRVETGAVVKNLSVEGEVTPSGTQDQIGGIVGINAGRIESCNFSGIVIGSDYIGGIAGKNEPGGVLSDCRVSGVVRGIQYTGGIAGQNAGTILRCSNTAAVNTAVNEEDIQVAEWENVESTLYSLLKREEVTENAVTNDTGGIAGYSNGILQSCTNSGAVGYPHVGYNVGGIAGRQNGYIANCLNRGSIQGRKDVGGIVGQMAPDITLQFSSNGLEELQSELNSLQALINRMLDDAQTASDTVSDRVSRISGYAESAQESAHSMVGQMGDFVDSNVDTVNNIMLIIERYLAKAAPIMEELATASESVTQTIAALRELLDTLNGMEDYNDQVLSQLQGFCSEMALACEALQSGLNDFENAFALMQGGVARPDTQEVRDDIAALREAAMAMETTIGKAMEEIDISGAVTPATKAQLIADLKTVLNCYAVTVRDTVSLIINTNFSALREQNLETLRQITGYLQSAMDSFSSAVGHSGSAMTQLADAIGTLRAINAQMDEVFAQLDSTLMSAGQASASLASAFSKTAQWAEELSGESPGSFSGLGGAFDDSSDALNISLSGISNELSALNGEMSDVSTALISDVRAVNNQFMKIMNLFLNVLNNTQNVDYTDVYEDVSEESLQSATRGKVLECMNYGDICADRNVGGVAGAMAIEYDLDPEDDLLSTEHSTARFTYQTRSILLDCNNYGTVQAKKSCAGGVVGRMDLGTVSGCGGYGGVFSENGDYVGGVCGLSLSSIRSSYAKCTLDGRKYIGGIVGSGSRVSDCLSMVEITESTQLSGAVAGEITGDYSGNCFVSDALAGVDRVSYAGKAEQITYEELCEKEGIPEEFLHLILRFVSEGRTLKTQTFDYGASFTEEVYPSLTEKENSYVHWDKSDLCDLRFDTVVTAVYEPYVTTLASAQQRSGHPVLLVQGKFREGDALRVSEGERLLSGDTVETWSIQIPDDEQNTHTVRWLLPEKGKNYAVYMEHSGSVKEITSEKNGSYLNFDMDGNGTITIVTAAQNGWWIWVVSAGVLVLVLVLFIWHRKHHAAGNKKTPLPQQP